MASKGVSALEALIGFIFHVMDICFKDGKLQLSVWTLLPLIGAAGPAFAHAGDIKDEVANLSPEDKLALEAFVMSKFSMEPAAVQSVVHDTLAVISMLMSIYGLFKSSSAPSV